MIDLSDPISRQQTITALRALSDEDGYINAPHEVVTDVVRGLPPVRAEHEQTTQAEQGETDKLGVKTGETWINVTCPNCGCEIHVESAQPEPLTDKEQRIFLAAMGREEKVCEEVDRNYVREPYEDSLMRVCKEIRRKVKGALWT